MIRFEVPGLPVAQPRQRHAIRKSKSGKAFVHNYTDEKDPVNAFKATVGTSASQVFKAPLNGPVRTTIVFVFPRTKGMVYKKRAMDREWKDSKPDLDNLEKSTWDALKGIAWIDDAQVCDSSKRKIYASGDEIARTIITIEPITEGPPSSEVSANDYGRTQAATA